MAFVDFEVVKKNVTMEQAISLLGLKVTRESRDQWRSACPSCRSGGDRIISISVKENLFQCFAAHVGGTVIDLVSHCQNISIREAAIQLQDRFLHRSTVPAAEGRSEESADQGEAPSSPAEIEERLADIERRLKELEEGRIVRIRR